MEELFNEDEKCVFSGLCWYLEMTQIIILIQFKAMCSPGEKPVKGKYALVTPILVSTRFFTQQHPL